MPIPAEISTSAAIFQQVSGSLDKNVANLSADEWNVRPNQTANSMLWVVGHMTWARSIVLKLLGVEWSRPWLDSVGYGSDASQTANYPSPQEAVQAFKEVSATLTLALEAATSAALSAPAPEKVPSYGGTIAGTIGFMAFHDAYHAGQVVYIRSCLGHKGTNG